MQPPDGSEIHPKLRADDSYQTRLLRADVAIGLHKAGGSVSVLQRVANEHLGLVKYIVRWVLLATPVGVAVGSACALFLWSLDRVTELRWQHGWLLFLLPVAGALVALLYHRFGRGAEGGTNLVLDGIHEPGAGGAGVPVKLAPLVLVGTLLTHLCGGSAGREGTAVQMGGAMAGGFARLMGRRPVRWMGVLAPADVRTLLMTGVAAGFGGVFGTPVAGAVFALEVPAIGRMSYAAALPCLLAAIVADRTCAMWGIHHTVYPQLVELGLGKAGAGSLTDWVLLAKVAAAGVVFGLASRLFSETMHGMTRAFAAAIKAPVLRPVVGGLLVIGLVYALGTRDYLGIGVTSPDANGVCIVSAFRADGAHTWSWFWKLVFTAVTLGAAFKGGEVTPLFFVGATLGNTLASPMGVPTPLMAGLGFVAVFAGATNTPLACTIMAVELFGPAGVVYFAVACFVAYLCSGHKGVYGSQRNWDGKISSGQPTRDEK